MCFFFLLQKVSFLWLGRSKILKVLSKTVFFLNIKAAKFGKNNIYKRKTKQKAHPDLTKVLVKKFRVQPVVLRRRKGGKSSFFSKKLISRKTQNKGKFCFFFDVHVCFLTVLSGNKLSFAAHQMHI